MRFCLRVSILLYHFDVASGGTIVGSAVLIDNVTVNDGVFSIELDFGTSPFAGNQIWLEIGVRDGTRVGGYTGLLPRQKLTPAPHALHAEIVADYEVNPFGVKSENAIEEVVYKWCNLAEEHSDTLIIACNAEDQLQLYLMPELNFLLYSIILTMCVANCFTLK